MLHTFALFLALAPASGVLSPEAAEYNAKAMRFYDAGQLAPAVDEFYAAFQSMPDAGRDLAGREQLVGAMRSTLLDLHEQTGEAAPICRLQNILQEHADALTAAFPNDPDKLETRSARARHEEATQQLAAFGPDACQPPPPPVTATLPAPEPSAPTSEPPPTSPLAAAKPPADVIPPRQLKIAGGVTLGLSAVLLGVMTYGIITEASQRARVTAINNKPADCPLTVDEAVALQGNRRQAVSGRQLAIGTGIAAGLTAALGTTLLVLARRSARAKRWSAAPWWSPSGAGLTLHVKLGTAR
ncbi:MAG: hypothetical protein H0T76_28525 [Nannocystis sp.]|nr:hypothetical protein [Nannocystis sp.]MBA3550440.1 hypothetical protein [Nannocystis sp.]